MDNLKIPTLESLISGIGEGEKKKSNDDIRSQPIAQETMSIESGELWNAFIKALDLPKEKSTGGSKVYNIDADIIETINQCDFSTSTTRILNTILRLFLLANLKHLSKLRKLRPVSLFDNINNSK